MNTRYFIRPLQALALLGAVLVCARAANAAATPTPTLVRFELSPLEHATPLTAAVDTCAMLVKAGRLAEADVACEHAIRAALTERAEATNSVVAYSPYQGLAAAYNNRAVLRYLHGNLAEAAADSSRALNVAPTPAVASTAAFSDAKLHRTAAILE